jgi:hypothetical protein
VNKGKREGRAPKEPDPRLTSHYLRTDRAGAFGLQPSCSR